MRIRESACHEVTARAGVSGMDNNKRPSETNGHMAYRNAGPGPHHPQMRVGPPGPNGGHPGSTHRPGGPNRYPPNHQFSRSHFPGGGNDGHRSRYSQHLSTSRRPFPDPGKDDDHPPGGAKASDAIVREQRERLRQKREDEAKRLEALRCGEQNAYQSDLEDFLLAPHVSCTDPMKQMHEIMKVTYLDQAPPSVRPLSPRSSSPSYVDPPTYSNHHRTLPASHSKSSRPEVQTKSVKPIVPDEKSTVAPSGSDFRSNSVPSHNQEVKIGLQPISSESRTKSMSRQHRDPVQAFSTSRLKPDQLTAAAQRAARAAASRDASPHRLGASNNSSSSDALQLVGGPSSLSHAQRGIAGKSTRTLTPEEIISSTSIPTTFITPIKQNLLADPQDFPLSGAITPPGDIMPPAPHIPPPPMMLPEDLNGSHHALGRGRDEESNRGGAVRLQVTPNGRCPSEPQQASSPPERLATFQPSISAPKKDSVMDDLTYSSSNTDNSLNESNSNDDDSSDSSDSTSSDNEDNEDNDNEDDLKNQSEGEKEDKVEVKKEVIDDDQGKDSSNWNLGYLFRSDESEAKTAESRSTASSGKTGAGKGRATEQKSSEARKSPVLHAAYGYDGSRLSDDSSDGEQMKSVVRPTPQVAPVPRTSDRQKSLLSSSDSSDENTVVPPVKINKRELPAPKLPAPAGNKNKGTAKLKGNLRGRPRKPANVVLESKAKSKAYVSTDDSSSDSEYEGRPAKPMSKAKATGNRKPTPKKTASSTNKENLPRHSTSVTGNVNSSKLPTTSRISKCQAGKSSLVGAYRVRDFKPLNKKEQLTLPNAVPDLSFVFPDSTVKKKGDKIQEKAEEMTRVTNSRTSDANKKEVLLTLYAKKDYSQNDPANKSKDPKKRSRRQLMHSKEGTASKISRPSKETDVQTSALFDALPKENFEHSPSVNAVETVGSSKRRREESSSGTPNTHKRSKNISQNISGDLDAEQPEARRNAKNNRSSKRNSPRDSGSSRCQSRSSNHEDATSLHSPVSHHRSSRVPLEGESSVAFRCRQSTLSTSVLPSASTVCSLPPAVVTPSSTPTVASSSVPLAAGTPSDDHTRRSPASAVVRNGLLVPNDASSNTINEVRLSDGHYKPSLPAGFKKVIPQPISSVYPYIGALEGFSLEEKFFKLFGVNEKKYQDRGKALKRIGDNEVDIIDRSVKYLEAFIFFALEGCALEQDPSTQKSAVPMFTQTIDLIRWVSSAFNNRKLSPPMSHKDFLVHCNPKLAVLCLFAQSLLSLKVYTIRSRELKESKTSLKKYCDNYDKKTSSNRTTQGGGGGGRGGSSNPTPACTSNSGGVGTGPTTASTPSGLSSSECRRAANSPSALSSTPSPAGSLNSESSTSSGYNTTPVAATPSPPQEPITMVEVPLLEHEQLVRHYSVTDYLTNAVEMWAEAQKYIRENELETFFACLDAAVCPLTLHSSLDELVIYIKAGLREIERIRLHYSGGGDTSMPYGGRAGGRNVGPESGTVSDPSVMHPQP